MTVTYSTFDSLQGSFYPLSLDRPPHDIDLNTFLSHAPWMSSWVSQVSSPVPTYTATLRLDLNALRILLTSVYKSQHDSYSYLTFSLCCPTSIGKNLLRIVLTFVTTHRILPFGSYNRHILFLYDCNLFYLWQGFFSFFHSHLCLSKDRPPYDIDLSTFLSHAPESHPGSLKSHPESLLIPLRFDWNLMLYLPFCPGKHRQS